MKQKISVQGMHCKSCSTLIKMALEDLGAKNIKITLNEKDKRGSVMAEYDGPKANLINAIKNEGYKAE